nr:hypothetical protein [Thauera sp.]
MNTAHIAVRTLVARCLLGPLLGPLLGLFLALPPAAFAASSGSSLLPATSQQSLPQSSARDSNCLSIEGGDPAAAHPCGE